MRESFFDPSWYRVADLRLQLRSHAQVHRQHFRGETWFIVQDHQSGQFHRLTPAANLLVSLMDGTRTINDIWELAGHELGDERPSQGEVIRLLSQLHRSDLLLGNLPPDFDELSRRAKKKRRQQFWQRIKNPLAIRIPAVDPDRFLTAGSPFVSWLFGPLGMLLWLCIVGTGTVLAGLNWDELTTNVADRILVGSNIIPIVVTYCIVKALHELGHGFAAKRWGGEIHEMGIMLLIFMPVPYVDASTSSSFRSKWQRAAVGGAGILVELFLAGIAMIVWSLVEQGEIRAYAFNVMTIAGISTLLFNGNPLLRFDGYYVLCDILEIPNLGNRANQYLQHMFKARILRMRNLEPQVLTPSERAWFVSYAISAWCYRLVLMATIAYFLITEIPIAGIALGAWIVFTSLGMPLWKGGKFLVTNPGLYRRRGRAIFVSAGGLTLLLLLIFGTPLPYTTIVEGVVWVPDNASIRTEAEGTVTEILATPNDYVAAGTPLIFMEDPVLDARIDVLEAEREELVLRLAAVKLVDRVQANMISEQIRRTDGSLNMLHEQAENRTVTAERPGRFVVSNATDLPGRFIERGASLGFIIDADDPIVHVLIDQEDIDLVRQRTDRVDVRFVQDLDRVVEARITRETPAAVENLPSPALGMAGGGELVLDPTDPENQKLLKRMFQVELDLAEPPPGQAIGGRVYVRFDHGYRPLLPRLARTLRQLFLGIADV